MKTRDFFHVSRGGFILRFRVYDGVTMTKNFIFGNNFLYLPGAVGCAKSKEDFKNEIFEGQFVKGISLIRPSLKFGLAVLNKSKRILMENRTKFFSKYIIVKDVYTDLSTLEELIKLGVEVNKNILTTKTGGQKNHSISY